MGERDITKERQKEKKRRSFGSGQEIMEWIQTIQRARIGIIGQNSQERRGGKSIDERKESNKKWRCP